MLHKKELTSHKFSEAKDDLILTPTQEQVLLGGLLGDMCIFKDKNCKHYRMNCAHSNHQQLYLEYKYNILKDIFSAPKERKWTDKRTHKEYTEYRIQSFTHPFFTDLYNKWYRNEVKIVPDDIYKISPLGLAIWYMDDGYKHISMGNYFKYIFSTNCFKENDLEKLVTLLYDNFGIKSTIQKSNNNISISSSSSATFINLIKPYVIETMKYKL